MTADVACTRCGSGDRLVGAYFRDRFKKPTAAIACQRCGLVWPVQMSSQLARDLLVIRGEAGGVQVEEAAQ